jgi:hypothetical protein
MLRFLFLILGIVVGWKLNDRFKDLSSTSTAALDSSKLLATAPSPLDHLSKSPQYAKIEIESEDPQKLALDKIRAELSENPPLKEESLSKLHIELSEDQVTLLEHNISELRDTTSTTFSNGGWTVQFHESKNFLRLIGIRDSDFIRSESLEKIKSDPHSQDLASRFESILKTLEE